MTEMLGPDLDDLKPGDLLRVVKHGKKNHRIEKVADDKKHRLLVLNLREPLYRVLKARATLYDKSIEDQVSHLLEDDMKSWMDVVVAEEFQIQYNEGKPKKE